MEILIAKESVEDYTELERLLIVAEGLRSGNIRKFVKEYNISHDNIINVSVFTDKYHNLFLIL